MQTGRGYEREQRRGYQKQLKTPRERPIPEFTAVELRVTASISTATVGSQHSRFSRELWQRQLCACAEEFFRAYAL